MLLSAATCFTGDGLVGQPCQADADCNPFGDLAGEALECRYDVCGYTRKCGDGIIDEAAEECDDGNLDDDDGCLRSCKLNVCGYGFVHQGEEECDDSNDANSDGCVSCKRSVCGDAVTFDGMEECDDGNLDNTGACTDTCKNATCGDGFVWAGKEECDDDNQDDSDACTAGCKAATCGDGHVWAGMEECDDSNDDDEDACFDTCELNMCGNGGSVLDLAAGSEHTCALMSGGRVRRWGGNGLGQLGIGTTNHIGDGPDEMPPQDAFLYTKPQ